MKGKLLALAAAAAALVAVACGESEPLKPDGSYLIANISGSVVDSHEGEAHFASRYHHRMEKGLFSVSSRDVNAAENGDSDRWIYVMGVGHLELPEDVAFTAFDPDTPGTSGFTVLYFRDGRSYVAGNGRLTAVRNTETVKEATFWFDAFRYGADCVSGERCPIPETPPANAEWISVEGSFVATERSDPSPFDQ
jgi:hypothetical protein